MRQILALRFLLVFMGGIVLLMVLWLATPSSLFYNPVTIALDGKKLTLLRETPFGQVNIRWMGEITLLDREGYQCEGRGDSIAQDIEGVMSATIGAWAWECIDAGPPLVLRYQYQVLLFGLIPLRPTGINITITLPTPEADKS